MHEGMIRRSLQLLVWLALAACFQVSAADPNKVLRLALPDIETLDPQSSRGFTSGTISRPVPRLRR
jgi:hypothetical protein